MNAAANGITENKDYYSLLEINNNATNDEIKKAYFSKVRQYPPETKPDDFRKIRQAYETLSDNKSREEYDNCNFRDEFDRLMQEAGKYLRESNYHEAEVIARKAHRLMPSNVSAQTLIGFCMIGKSEYNQAVNYYKELVRKNPDCSDFLFGLGKAFYYSGFEKQALDAFRKADEKEADPYSRMYIAKMMREKKQYEIAWEYAVSALEIDDEIPDVYIEPIRLSLILKKETLAKKYASRHIKLIDTFPDLSEAMQETLYLIAYNYMEGCPDACLYILTVLRKLDPESYLIRRIHRNLSRYKKLRGQYEQSLKDNQIHTWIKDIINFYALPDEKSETKILDNSITERLISVMPRNAISSVERLKTEYPQLYSINKKYFEALLSNPDGIKIDMRALTNDINLHAKMCGYKAYPEGYCLTPEDLIVPAMQKFSDGNTGRNDPCPCGSGVKYKKCCGR